MILVTGAAGFIGSVLVSELNKRGREDILISDRLGESDSWKNLVGLKYYDYIHADSLLAPENLEIFKSISFIFHMGACSSTLERDMDYLMSNNFHYSQALFELATDCEIPFIYASSAATYGDGEGGYSDQHELIKALKPLNQYGYSKQLMDEWVLKQEETPPWWYGIKFFNVFGPNEYHKGEMRSLVHKAYGQIQKEGKVKLFKSYKEGFKDGHQLRDFVYVVDVVKAMISMMNQQKGSGIYNMGTGKARSFYDLIEATFKALKLETNIEYIEMPEDLREQYQYFTQAQMDKFQKLCPDFEFMSLEDAVADYVQNYLVTNKHF